CSSFSCSRLRSRPSRSAFSRASASISSAQSARNCWTSRGSNPFHLRENSCFWISSGVIRGRIETSWSNAEGDTAQEAHEQIDDAEDEERRDVDAAHAR